MVESIEGGGDVVVVVVVGVVVAVLLPRVRGVWENLRQFILRLRFCFFVFVEISSRTLIPLYTPGSVRSGSAS